MPKKTIEKPPSIDIASLSSLAKKSGPAPVHLWDPPYCGDMDMRVLRDGTWLHEGRPIRRQAMIQLFSSVLKREGDKHYLVTPVEKVGIKVDDCPFVAQTLEVATQDGEQLLNFTLNNDEQVIAGHGHEISVDEDPISGEPHPIIHVRDGLMALLSRSVFYQLVELAEAVPDSGGDCIGVSSRQCFFKLGKASS